MGSKLLLAKSRIHEEQRFFGSDSKGMTGKLGGRVAHFGNEFKKIRAIVAREATGQASRGESSCLIALAQPADCPRMPAAVDRRRYSRMASAVPA